MGNPINITSPVGRIVLGSLYEPNDTDAEGKPLVFKNGPDAGKPRVNYFFALAIPKTPGVGHWGNEPGWGQQIWAFGNQAFPNIAQSPTFAWKIEDGDSAIPNRKGRKNIETEGFPGHWILKFSGGYSPRVYREENGAFVQVVEKDWVKPGYYVEVNFSVDSNNSTQQPGIYLNHSMVCFRAYGAEIVFGPNVNDAGFGKSALPAGASATPPASTMPPPAAPGAPAAPLAPAGAALPPASGVTSTPTPPVPGIGATSVSPSNPIPVVPNPNFTQVPPPAAPAAPVHQMTAKAAGASYEQFKASGWSDEQLVANGYMLA